MWEVSFCVSETWREGGWSEERGREGVEFNFIFEIISFQMEGIGNSVLSKSQPSFYSPITKMIFKSKAEMLPSSNPS